jgi:hypothetical protein
VSISALHPDDKPDPTDSDRDRYLNRQLVATLRKRFYENCNGVVQAVLTGSDWSMSNTGKGLLLEIRCPDQSLYCRILNYLAHLGTQLEVFSKTAQIQIDPPPDMGDPLLLAVDEIETYKDTLQSS